jgi:hypothetical protein
MKEVVGTHIEVIPGDGTVNLTIATCGVLVTVVMSAPFPYSPRLRALKNLPNSNVMEH